MANYCLICDILLFLIVGAFSQHDEHYYYKITNANNDVILHKLDKREVPLPQKPLDTVAYVLSTTVPPTNTTTNTKIMKNLGENGAGQRKNITTTETITTKIQSTDNNSTNKLNTTITTTTEKGFLGFTTDDDDKQFTLTGFDDPLTSKFNKTLAHNNITIARTDSHFYYNSTFKTDKTTANFHWVEFSNRSDVIVSDLLSRSHRRAVTVKLSFDFPFYGHLIRTVTIATGGFLYTGDYVHSWLAATQYIAPLMANFDTSLSDHSFVKYIDNGTAFIVQWENVTLQDRPSDGQFTFQTTLHNNGDIVFVYQKVPVIIENIHDDYHPVKVGLSDAYIMDRTIFFVRRKTIYEYHRVHFPKEDIKNFTVIYLRALPTCLDSKDCTSCLGRKLDNFQCVWCPAMNRCSNGFDRNRQEWLTKGCDKKNVNNVTMCTQIQPTEVANVDEVNNIDDQKPHREFYDWKKSSLQQKEPVKMSVSSIVAILFLISMFTGMGMWLFYAYRNPHTTSGQILIRYRPSQWRWRRGEARYTAATIHM